MAYFVNVGPFPENWSGVGSRGYQLFRRDCTIVTRWAGIEVTPKREFRWCHKPKEKIYKFKSVLAAKEEMRKMIRHRIEVEGYSRLPAGIKITE